MLPVNVGLPPLSVLLDLLPQPTCQYVVGLPLPSCWARHYDHALPVQMYFGMPVPNYLVHVGLLVPTR